MSRPRPGSATLIACGVLVSVSVVQGLPLRVTVPVAGTLLVLLGLLFRGVRPAGTGMAVLVVVTATMRNQLEPSTSRTLTTSALVMLLLLTSMPFLVGRRVAPLAVIGLTAAAPAATMLVLILSQPFEGTGPVVYVVGLTATATAYALAIPSRRADPPMWPLDTKDGG